MACPKTAVIWILPLLLALTSAQHLGLNSVNGSGICQNVHITSITSLQRLQNCVVVVGNLRIVLMETTKPRDFQKLSFPNLREVTGYLVVYRVKGLGTLRQLLPNLTRIRGAQLINNYALIVHDMFDLREVGLYSLLKIDRGGVIITGGPHTCYVNTINWSSIAPQSRLMLTVSEISAHCNTYKPCRCNADKSQNFCWNSKKCQRFVTGPHAEQCNKECLGCRSNAPDVCSVCKEFTLQGRCVDTCPAHTIVLPDNQYCVTKEECRTLNGWKWNNTCVFECPVNYRKIDVDDTVTCVPCPNCQKVCSSLIIDSLSAVQKACRCVIVNGSLTIHVRSVPGIEAEMREHLSRIEIVNDYVIIFGSQLKSLSFLSSLKRIAGENLRNDTYNLIIYDMQNLVDLFSLQVMKDLIIDRGRLQLYNNPKLCLYKLQEFKKKFPEESNSTDIPLSLNGYSGGCEDVLGLRVDVLNETTANVIFIPKKDPNIQYTVLYSRIPTGTQATPVPETCRSEWFAAHALGGKAFLTSLRPAATYAVCIETYAFSKETLQTYLARTSIVNFTTPFRKPEPPVIQELSASSPNTVNLRWTDHIDYRQHITHHQLDVILIDIHEKDLKARDHCEEDVFYDVRDNYNRHAVVVRAPRDYDACGPNCVTLTEAPDDFIEEHFDVCSSDSECDNHEELPPKNSTFNGFIRTLSLEIRRQNLFRVKGLAPFRDYKFRLRSCVGGKCSRSSREVVRTLRCNKADVPSISDWGLNETGHLFIKWTPPNITNGPVLAYTVQILTTKEMKENGSIPDTVCIYPEHLNMTISLKPAKEYTVRVCSATLGSLNACTQWLEVLVTDSEEYKLLLISLLIMFSIGLALVSVGIGFWSATRNKPRDMVPLVNLTSMYRNESEPPNVVMLSDFTPLYSVPFNDALI